MDIISRQEKLIKEIEEDIKNKVDSKKIARKFKLLVCDRPKARLRSLDYIIKELEDMKERYKEYNKNKKVYMFEADFSRFEQHFLHDKPNNIFFIFDDNDILRGICSVDGTDVEEYGKKIDERKRKIDEETSKMIKKYNEAIKEYNKAMEPYTSS